MAYAGIVSRITTRPHPNADKLKIGICHGHQVVVGSDTQDGDLGIFFPSDGALSHEFCLNNGLYNAEALHELGIPFTQGETLGYFGIKRRIRAQNFRGQKSDGFWCPLSYLNYLDPGDGYTWDQLLAEGDQITVIRGEVICEKYYSEATRRAMARTGQKPRPANPMFPKHVDTAQFRFMTDLPAECVMYITEKLHGTSGRYGLVLEEQPNPWYRRLFGLPPKKEWVYLNGSRNVTLSDASGPGFYGTNEFRYNVTQGLTLRKGEVLFFEIVGYIDKDRPIMPAQDVTKLKDKALEKTYGKRMFYTYGCEPGEHKMYVYKIMQFNEDGHGLELSWTQMRQRCQELGLQTVPLLKSGYVPIGGGDQFDLEIARRIVEELMDGPSKLDNRHIREGVVVRLESPHGVTHVKAKSFNFGVLEGYIKDSEDYVDVEESA